MVKKRQEGAFCHAQHGLPGKACLDILFRGALRSSWPQVLQWEAWGVNVSTPASFPNEQRLHRVSSCCRYQLSLRRDRATARLLSFHPMPCLGLGAKAKQLQPNEMSDIFMRNAQTAQVRRLGHSMTKMTPCRCFRRLAFHQANDDPTKRNY